MENKSYFGGIAAGMKTLAVGLKTTLVEYFTPKSTEQYPENRKTTLHVAKRHRGRLVFKRGDDGAHRCVACTMCEKACPNGTIKILSEMRTDEATGKKKRVLLDYQYDLGDCMFCQLCTTISRTACSTVARWCSTSTRKSMRAARCHSSSTEAHHSPSASSTPKPSKEYG